MPAKPSKSPTEVRMLELQRDDFAAAIAPALIRSLRKDLDLDKPVSDQAAIAIAMAAYKFANAMMAVREKLQADDRGE